MLRRIRASETWSERNLAEKGFTLIELLVVVAILGILAAVVVFSVGGVTSTANTNACKTDSTEIRTAVAAYQAKHNATDQPTEAQLVTDTELQAQSTLYTLTWPSGVMTLTGINGCTGIAG